MRRFFGKYRGKVASTKDPFHLGRIQVQVPSILGEGRLSWALPSTPFAGKDIGLFTVPPVNSNIWVEFEGGDPDYPIWTGCFWGADELPQDAKVSEPDKVQVFRTNGVTCTVSDLVPNKGVTLIVEEPVVTRKLKMVFNADGIEINNKDETTIKITADMIELKNKVDSTVTIRQDDIQLKESSVEIKLTATQINLVNTPSTIELTQSEIKLAQSTSNMKLAASGIELSATPAQIKIAPGSLDLTNAAASIKLSPASVNVNNGALEVI